ncbi:MAG: helix-turn-helix domain-containing protein [Lentisphaeria bacterium]|nr:helix-turn-helix domain-containing protein [Lentisphaeria bacterium]
MAEVLVRSVKKALDALDVIVEGAVSGEGVGLSDIAAVLDEKLPTLRNILKTMEHCEYVARDGRRYVPGPKCSDINRSAQSKKLLATLDPQLRALAAKTGESLVLCTFIHGQRVLLGRYPGANPVSVNIGVAEYKTEYSLVTTRIMLAQATPPELDLFRKRHGEPGQEWLDAAHGRLGSALDDLREAGFAAEKNSSFCAYAVALQDANGALLGAVGAYAPSFRVTAPGEEQLVAELKQLAANALQAL